MEGSLWRPAAQSTTAGPPVSNAADLWQPPGAIAASAKKPTMMPSQTRSKLKAEIDKLNGELSQVRQRLAESEKSQKALSEQIKELLPKLVLKRVQPKPANASSQAPTRPAAAREPAALPAVANSCAKKRKRDTEFKSLDWNTIAMPADNARDGKRFPVAYDAGLIESVPVRSSDLQRNFPKGEPLDWSRITALAISKVFDKGIYNDTTRDLVQKLHTGDLKCVSMVQIRPRLKNKRLGRVIKRSNFFMRGSEEAIFAAAITMIGVPLPNEQACERCKNLEGPFQFCTVLRGHGKGSCNNCIHDEEGNYCTFRDDDFRRGRPNWIPEPIEAP